MDYALLGSSGLRVLGLALGTATFGVSPTEAETQWVIERYPILLLPSSTEPAFEQDADTHSADRMRQLVRAQ